MRCRMSVWTPVAGVLLTLLNIPLYGQGSARIGGAVADPTGAVVASAEVALTSGRCVEDDNVFSLAEQRNSLVESGSRVRRVEVNAGHVEIVGDKRVAPTKLIAILQEQGVLRPTAPERVSAFSVLLSQIYRDDELP